MSVNLPALLESDSPRNPTHQLAMWRPEPLPFVGDAHDAMKATGGSTLELVEAVDAVRADARWGPANLATSHMMAIIRAPILRCAASLLGSV